MWNFLWKQMDYAQTKGCFEIMDVELKMCEMYSWKTFTTYRCWVATVFSHNKRLIRPIFFRETTVVFFRVYYWKIRKLRFLSWPTFHKYLNRTSAFSHTLFSLAYLRKHLRARKGENKYFKIIKTIQFNTFHFANIKSVGAKVRKILAEDTISDTL